MYRDPESIIRSAGIRATHQVISVSVPVATAIIALAISALFGASI